MKNLTIACLGAGNMGTALLRGMLRAKTVTPSRLRAADRSRAKREAVRNELKIKACRSNVEAVTGADLVLLAVKPQILDEVLSEIRDHLSIDALLVSVAAGYPTGLIERLVGGKPRVVRSMPNIAATVRMSATGICAGRWAKRGDLKLATRLFETVGTVATVDERLMDAVTGLSGTGPMYIFIIIEALADSGVKVGISRDQATELAIQTVLGAAQMVKDTGLHPIYLKDMVTSPGGTAINALYSMEKTGLRADLMDAVEAATRRSAELGRPVGATED